MKRAVAPFEDMEAEMERLLDQGEAALEAWGALETSYALCGGYEIDGAIEREAALLGFEGGGA